MDATIRSRSIVLSVVIHAILFLLLLFTVMTTPIPPFPEVGGGGGVLVDIGTVDEASGTIQPMSAKTSIEPVYEKTKITPSQEEPYATQNNEEAPVIKTNVANKKVIKKTEPVTNVTKQEPIKVADPRSIYQGKTNDSRSQGTGTGTGDQGKKNGDPNALYSGSGGTGGRGTGTGTGDGDGAGSGTGSGNGNGISFSLSGRNMVRAPQVNDRSQETGKVVVDITVDKNGAVIGAIPGGRGSTTTSQYLYRLAKEAAMRAKFNVSANEADIQKGTMTFVFVVQ